MGKRLTKRRIFDIIQLSNVSDTPSRLFDYFLGTVIVVNIIVMFLETFDSMSRFNGILDGLALVTVLIFTVEYALRLWTAEYLFPTLPRRRAILKFMISFDGVVELLTILPFFFLDGFVALRMLRVVRILHLFRVNTAYDSFNVITTVLDDKKNQIISSLFIVWVLMLAASLCMYSVEHPAQPDKFQNAFSGMWWSVSALLTVGYGDIYPITTLGRIMAVIISFLGVGLVAIPTGIISAGFVEQYSRAEGANLTFDAHVTTIHVSLDSNWIGKSVEQLKQEYGMLILMVNRRGNTFQPGDDFRVELEDELCVYVVNNEHLPKIVKSQEKHTQMLSSRM